MTAVKQTTTLPIMAMIRPRPGGFCYSRGEFTAMRRDVDAMMEWGAEGIVFGLLTADCRIDIERCREMLRQIESASRRIQTVFHRAFDFTPDAVAAMSQLIDLGFIRVLTSGQKLTARQGTPLIGKLIGQSAGRIEILPAAGIRAINVTDLISQTGCSQIHASLREPVQDPGLQRRSDSLLAKSMGGEFWATSETQLRALLATIRRPSRFT
jgi:copper homeostasis protein